MTSKNKAPKRRRLPTAKSPPAEAAAKQETNAAAGVTLENLPERFRALAQAHATEIPNGPPDWLGTRRFMMGLTKYGKSASVAGQAHTAFADLEGGLSYFHRHIPRSSQLFRIRTYEDLIGLLETLEEDAKSPQTYFRHVVVDTADRLMFLVMDQLTSEKASKCSDIVEYAGGKGGYDMIARRFMTLVRRIYSAGYGWTLVGHITNREVTLSDGRTVTGIFPSLTPKITNMVKADTDLTWRLESRVVFEETKTSSGKPTTRKTRKRLWKTRPEEDEGGFSVELGSRVPVPTLIEVPTFEGDNPTVVARHLEEVYETARSSLTED